MIPLTPLSRLRPRRGRGASALEYALLIIIMVVGLVVFFRNFGDDVSVEARQSAREIEDRAQTDITVNKWTGTGTSESK